MLHLFSSATEARRLPGASQFPWREIGLGLIVLASLAAVALGVREIVSRVTSGDAPAPAVQVVEQQVAVPVVPAAIQPVAQPFDSAQGEPEVAAPVAPVVTNYEVVWTEVDGTVFNPSTLPVEEGIYDATYSWIGKGGYGEQILPHLADLPVAVAATRDAHNKNIVLVSLDADRYGPYLLLSVDGEKSWCRLNLIPITWEGQATNGVTPEEVRVSAQGEKISLYGRYALGSGPSHLYWWETTATKSELPCS